MQLLCGAVQTVSTCNAQQRFASGLQVWSALDQKVGVYARQSILKVPLGFVQRWFLSGR